MMSLPCFGVTRMLNKERKKSLFQKKKKTKPKPNTTLKTPDHVKTVGKGFSYSRLWVYIHVLLANILGSILKSCFDPLRTSYPLGSGLIQYWKCQDSSCNGSNLDEIPQEQLFLQYFKPIWIEKGRDKIKKINTEIRQSKTWKGNVESRMRARKYTFVEGLRNQMGKLRETFGKKSKEQKADRGGKICEGEEWRGVTHKHRKEPKNTIEGGRGSTKGRETITNRMEQK